MDFSVEDQFNRDLVNTWIGAGLPLHALDNEGLKNFMEKNTRRTIPTSKTLQTSYIKNNYESKLELLKHNVKNFESFYVMFDEADYNGKKYFTFLVCELGNQPKPPYLIEITVGHQAPTSVIVHQKLMRALAKVGLATEYEKFRLFVTDNASYNSTCAKQVKVIFTNVIQF